MDSIIPQINLSYQPQLFEAIPENRFSLPIFSAISLSISSPQIIDSIRGDQDNLAIDKKIRRQKDQEWQRNHGSIPLLADCEKPKSEVKLSETGRTRMLPEVLFVFLVVRGFLGSIKDSKSQAIIQESKTLGAILQYFGILKPPAPSTILENLNCISEKTLLEIHEVLIKNAVNHELDDFQKLYFDSTRIAADSAWPTESKTMSDLCSRIRNSFVILQDYNIKINFPSATEDLLNEINSEKVSIALISGKPGSKLTRKKSYQIILKLIKKLLKTFKSAVERAHKKIGDILPSIKEGLLGLIYNIRTDIHNLELCADNARTRVIKNKTVEADQKVLGISDEDAAIITKGNRQPVFGFKPQIGRSEKGFIVAAIIPEGAASDANQMIPITNQAMSITGIKPSVLSYDDGYTNKVARKQYLDKGIKVVSFSGAKGKKQIEDWNEPEYLEARNKRSMAESTMSTIKCFFGLNRFTRRGLSNVTKELLTAVVFHNISLLGKLVR